MTSIRELIFRTRVDPGNSEKEVDKVTDSVEELDDSVKTLSKSNSLLGKTFEEVYGDVKPLSGKLAEMEDIMYELALAGKENTDQFRELQAETARYRQTIISVDAQVDALAQKGGGLKAALELGANITAGYGALQGAMALTGAEGEELQETMVKLQAVQSVLSGIETVRAGLQKESLLLIKAKSLATKSLTVVEWVYAKAVGSTTGAVKALRIAMLALPIVLVIGLVTALVGWLVSMSEETEDVEAANDKLTDSFERQSKVMSLAAQNYERDINNRIRLAKLMNGTEEEILALERKRLAIRETSRKQELKAINDNATEQVRLWQKAYDQGDYDLAKKIRGEYVANKQRYAELKSLDGQYQEDLRALRLEYENKQRDEQDKIDKEAESKAKEAAKRRQEARKAEAQKRLEETRAYEDLMASNIADEDLRRITQLRIQQSRELQEVRNKYGNESKLIAELEKKQETERAALIEEFRKQEEEARKGHEAFVEQQRKDAMAKEFEDSKLALNTRLALIEGDFMAEQSLKRELATLEMQEALAQENLTFAQRELIQKEFNDRIDALDQELADKQIERRKRVEEAATNVATQGLTAIQDLSSAFFDAKMSRLEEGSQAELRTAKKAFEWNKKLQIAQAIVQGIQSTMAAYTSGAQIPFVGLVTGPLFAAAAAATAIANIAKIKNSTFESPGSAGGSTPAVAPPAAPEFSATTQTAGLPGSGTQNTGSADPMKVVLLDSDLKANNRESAKVDLLHTMG